MNSVVQLIQRPVIVFLLMLVLSALGCKTDPTLVTVQGNVAPPDYTVPEAIKENYITKSYIALLGRKPTEQEFASCLAILDRDNSSIPSRKAMLELPMGQAEYLLRMYATARAELLNNLDPREVEFRIKQLEELLASTPQGPLKERIQQEIDRLEALLSIPEDLLAGSLDRIGMHRRCIDNSFYDEINMGSLNFVVSLFEHFFRRYPSTAEEEAAVTMVEGFNAVVLGKAGGTKLDFLDIFFGSADYYEGQVVDIYERYLYRSPGSVEMSERAGAYQSSGNYDALLVDILSSDDYFGL